MSCHIKVPNVCHSVFSCCKQVAVWCPVLSQGSHEARLEVHGRPNLISRIGDSGSTLGRAGVLGVEVIDDLAWKGVHGL